MDRGERKASVSVRKWQITSKEKRRRRTRRQTALLQPLIAVDLRSTDRTATTTPSQQSTATLAPQRVRSALPTTTRRNYIDRASRTLGRPVLTISDTHVRHLPEIRPKAPFNGKRTLTAPRHSREVPLYRSKGRSDTHARPGRSYPLSIFYDRPSRGSPLDVANPSFEPLSDLQAVHRAGHVSGPPAAIKRERQAERPTIRAACSASTNTDYYTHEDTEILDTVAEATRRRPRVLEATDQPQGRGGQP